jgi:PAS domain S-box-containing protein
MLLFSRTSGVRTPASRGCWALCRLQPTAGIINLCALALLTIFAIPSCALSSSAAVGQPREKNVLVLFSAVQYSQSFLELIEPSMRARVRGPITFYRAYLEDPQVEEKSYRESMSETLRRRYAQVKLDVVIVCNPAALHFAVEYRDKMFPGVPIVFAGVGAGDLENQKIWPGVTGVASPWGFRDTIDLMLRLQPDTNTVAVVAGDTRWDKQFVAVAHEELLRHQDKVNEIDLVGPVNRKLLERVTALPPHTVVLFQAYPQFENQPEFGTWDLVAAVAQRLPTYSAFPRLCIDGCIGGAYEDATKEALWTAEIAARVLSGERPDNIPVVYATDLQIRVDWRALRRWQIPESALPLGSVVLNREPTLWERYRKYVVAAIAVIAAQLLLILGLLWQRAKRRKVEASLVESLRFEGLLADLSTTFINLPEDEVDANIEKNLGRIAEFFNIERITFLEFSAKKTELIATFSWTAKGINPPPSVVAARQFPHWTNRLLRGEVVLASALPGPHEEEASPEKEYLRQHGAMSAALVPLTAGGEALGFISFVSTKCQVPWADDVIKQMRALAEIFSNALRRKRADEVLRESEGRFRLVADNAPSLIWMAGTDKLRIFFNKGWLDFTGRSMEQELGDGWVSGVHPDDLERCLATYSTAFDARADFEMEYRLRRFDGEYSWIVDYGVPRFESDGTFCGYIGSCVDITERKSSEASLHQLSGRLIDAQEQERTRIARELHADFSQRMALLQIRLEQLGQENTASFSSKARQQLHSISEIASEISSNIHDLSHQLHPSKLDTLGLMASVRGLCREFSEQHKLQVRFVHEDISGQIPKDVTLCLFRIVQEALRNVVKHSGASEAAVELSGQGDGIDLCISDDGVGFETGSAKGAAGLGLISMRERLRLVGGNIVIESEPLHGTKLHAHVPLPASKPSVTSQEKTYKARA